jgi:hypothetical protein
MNTKIVLLMIISLLLSSCGMEPESLTEFIVKNSSSHNVEFTIFNGELPHKVGAQTITILLNEDSEESYIYTMDGENRFYDNYVLGGPDSVYITFDNNRLITYKPNEPDPRNFIDISSWEGEKMSDTHYIYTYSITNEDYENATEIK